MTILRLLLAGLAHGLRWIGRALRRLHAGVASSARTVTGRLRDQWQADSGYRRTLIAALSAITATVLPHPAIAAALGATLAQRTARPLYRPVPSRRFDLVDDAEFDDDPDQELEGEDQPPGPLVRDPWRPSPPGSWRNLD